MIQGTASAAFDLELGNRGDAGQQLVALATTKVDEHMTMILKRIEYQQATIGSAFARRHRETISTLPQALSVPARLGAEPLALALPWRPPLHCTVVRQPLLVNTCSTDSIR